MHARPGAPRVMTTLAQAFEIPPPEEITALGYVVVLEDDPSQEKVRQLVQDYVLTPAVRAELRTVLSKLRTALKRGDDMGRFIHGSARERSAENSIGRQASTARRPLSDARQSRQTEFSGVSNTRASAVVSTV